jgi:hypothetical protein
MYIGDESEHVRASCALGAAVAAGWVLDDPVLYTPVFCPVCGSANDPIDAFHLRDAVIHLNDDHRWTRDRIADFVATVEPGDSEPAVQPDAVRGGLEATGQPVLTPRV